MIVLAEMGHPRQAVAFVDYLLAEGIQSHFEEHDDGQGPRYLIMLHAAADAERAGLELKRFIENPGHPRYRGASWENEQRSLASDGHQQRLTAPLYRSRAFQVALANTGPLTGVVLVLCVLVYLLTAQGELRAIQPFLFFRSPDELLSGEQPWRWITPAFLHFGIFHLAFNLVSWWVFGGLVERAHSSLRLFTLFLVCGVLANVVQFFWSGNLFGGLSGVVYAVLGYLWLYGVVNPAGGIRLPVGLVVVMLVSLALGFTGLLPFANQAHLAGLISGCLLGAMYAGLDRSLRR